MRTRKNTRWAAAMAVALVWPTVPAAAPWFKAETERFIVYGQGREARVRNLALRLSVFDAVLRLANPSAPKTQPRKLEVYLVDSQRDVRRAAPWTDESVGGFYTANAGATFALANESVIGIAGDEVLFHEYAHAFMLENFPAAYPGWFIEGWAEYFMTTKVMANSAEVGRYNSGRAYSLFESNWIPWDVVISKAPWELRSDLQSVYYSQAWLLMHYMRSDAERSAQLTKATLAIAMGEDPVKAMEAASGKSLEELGRKLRNYRKLVAFTINDPLPNPPEIKVSTLPPSAEHFLLDNLRLSSDASGGDEADAALVVDLRRRAQRWPDDRAAELTLARAEFAYGDVAAGEAIVKRRLERDPKDVEALLVAGMGQLKAGERDKAQLESRFNAARPYLIKAYALDEDDYRILLAYARSRTVDPAYPNDNDVNALLTVRAMAPTVDAASIMAGEALLLRDRKPEALAILSIVANNPHGGGNAQIARALMNGQAPSELALAAEALDKQSAPPAK